MLLAKLFESRATLNKANPRDPIVAEWFGAGSNTDAGVAITADNAMRITAVNACVRLLSNAIAGLPIDVINRQGDERTVLDNHPLSPLLRWQPNSWQTSFEWREMMIGHLLLRGAGYNFIDRDNAGRVRQLIPLHPDKVMPFRSPDGSIAYRYKPENGDAITYLNSEIHSLLWRTDDGFTPISPISEQREALGLASAAESFGAKYFGNGTVVSGVLEHPGALSDEAYDRLKRSWEQRHTGAMSAHKPAILEDGMKWTALGVKPEEAQFLETRKFQVEEIARMFGVPPHLIGAVDSSTSWGSGLEQQNIAFVIFSLTPLTARWEQTMKRDLLSTSMNRRNQVKFNMRGLMRGDSAARATYYNQLFNLGALSPNDIRRLEDLNPHEDGDGYYVQLNMGQLGVEPVEPEPAPEPEPETDDDGDEPAPDERMLPVMNSIADKIATAQKRALTKALDQCDGDAARFEVKAAEFVSGHRDFVVRNITPLMVAVGADAEPVADALVSHLTRLLISAVQSDITEHLDQITAADVAAQIRGFL